MELKSLLITAALVLAVSSASAGDFFTRGYWTAYSEPRNATDSAPLCGMNESFCATASP